MNQAEFEERLRLAIARHENRVISPELARQIEADLIAELADIRDEITVGYTRLEP